MLYTEKDGKPLAKDQNYTFFKDILLRFPFLILNHHMSIHFPVAHVMVCEGRKCSYSQLILQYCA